MKGILLVIIGFIGTAVQAQSEYILPGTLSDDIADRWEILYDFDHPVYSTQRNTSRKDLAQRAYHLLGNQNLSSLDLSDIRYILEDNSEYDSRSFNQDYKGSTSIEKQKVYDSTGVFYYLEDGKMSEPTTIRIQRKPILKHFYHTKANFFEINNDRFKFRVNPILNLKYGNATDDPDLVFQNKRGIEMRGIIDDKIYFYTNIHENQQGFNNYIDRRIDRDEAIPGQGLFKPYKSAVIENLQGYDFLNAQAYVGINATESVAIEFGHGKHFLGNGIRSLYLSDYGNNYFYLKFNTRIWKFHYQNLFAELSPISSLQNPKDRLLPKKYMANHYLSFRPNKNLEFGIFEAIVFERENHFEFQYLNPVILYRTVEHGLDSPDNALVGINAKWNIKNKAQIYTQLIFDEFNLDLLTAGTGSWANKYGFQLGAKLPNVLGIDHLDAQIEYNLVRPYTYSHSRPLDSFPEQSTASYSHFNQPLAHPLGSNFVEVVAHLRYQPTEKLFINARAIRTTFGQDTDGLNYGNNILLNSTTRVMDFGNEIGQGVNTRLISLGIDVSYQFAHNYFLDLNLLYRNADADIDELDLETKYIGGGLRVNMGEIRLDY